MDCEKLTFCASEPLNYLSVYKIIGKIENCGCKSLNSLTFNEYKVNKMIIMYDKLADMKKIMYRSLFTFGEPPLCEVEFVDYEREHRAIVSDGSSIDNQNCNNHED